MKIAILCLAMYAYVVCASEQSVVETETKHIVYDSHQNLGYTPFIPNQVYGPVVQPQPRPQLQPWPFNRNSEQVYGPQSRPELRSPSSSLFNNLLLYALIRSLNPSTTTAAVTTPTATIPAATITTSSTTEATTTAAATANPLAGWRQEGPDDCYYFLPLDIKNWNDAQAECGSLIEGGRLATTAFSNTAGQRGETMRDIGTTGMTFWIGVKGQANPPSGVVSMEFVGSSEDTDPSGAGFTAELDQEGLTMGDEVCGRVDAEDISKLLFVQCDLSSLTRRRRYLCEVCEENFE